MDLTIDLLMLSSLSEKATKVKMKGVFVKMRRSYLVAALGFALVLLCTGFSFAQQKKTAGGQIIVCMVQVEHADVDYLASVLEPFLSPEGHIVPYKPANTLIIKDRAPVVNMLAQTIKGKPCTEYQVDKGLIIFECSGCQCPPATVP